MPVIRASLLAVLALISCALALNLARAQDPAAETATTLHPGVNLIGWTAEPTPTSQLFREIPQLEAIWAWDAELDDWIVAARGAPEWLGGLGRITPGMGLRMQLSGNEPYLWQRSTEPTRGLVKLRAGWNLVAWSGADQTPIDDALKGIGWSLRNVHRWNPATQQWSIWTSPERTAQLIAANNTDQETNDDSEMPAIRRGEALWINVARAVNWLQPTDLLPRLIFPGGASDELQARVREDLEAVLSFYRTQYGIQADPDFTIYAAKDVDALIQAYRDGGEGVDDAYEASTRDAWNHASGWADGEGEIVVKQSGWPDDLSTDEVAWARYTLTHEYLHLIERHLVDRDGGTSGLEPWSPLWLTEGTAEWAESHHQIIDGSNTWESARKGLLSAIINDTPSLRSTELGNAGWEYTLGWLAIDRLTGEADIGLYVEYWRQLGTTEIGSHDRWTSSPGWRTAFRELFGVPVSKFYADFDAWLSEQAVANRATVSSTEGDIRWIRGRATNESGAPVTGALVGATRVVGDALGLFEWTAETGSDGMFAVRVPQDGDYLIEVHSGTGFDTGCSFYYNDGELIGGWEWQKARPITLDGSDLQGVNVRMPSDMCGQIRGQVVSAAGEPLAGVSITCLRGRGCAWPQQTAPDGTFTVTVEDRDDYRLSLNLTDRCAIRYRSGDPTLSTLNGSSIGTADNDVNGLRLQVPSDLCRQRVAGSIEGIERFSRGLGVSVRLCRTGSTWCAQSASRELDRDGSFTVAVPTAGSYWLSYFLNGCQLHHGPTGLTGNPAEAVRFNAGESDVRIGHRRVSDTMCAYQISGTIIGSDGVPLDAWTRMGACEQVVNGRCDDGWAWVGSDGSFAVTVPVNGVYRLGYYLDRCIVYFSQDGLTSNINDAQLFRVDGRDVQLSPRQVSAGLCDQ